MNWATTAPHLLQLSDLQRFEDHLFIEGFADPLFHLVDKIFLKGDLGEVDPFPLFGPGDVPLCVNIPETPPLC